MSSTSSPAEGTKQTIEFNDKVVRQFMIFSIIWGVVAMLAGLVAAFQLNTWRLNFGLEYLTFGRLRPLHTNAAIFAFVGNMMFAGIYYSTQRLCKVRMASDKLSAINMWGWQFIIVCAAATLPLGLTRGKEYAELIWPINILVAAIWVVFAINFFWTLKIRNERSLYVALWFYISTVITIAMLYIVNHLSIPTSLTHSYPIFAGVQDALVQWWYGHNAVAFFLTTPILGIMYYFMPKAANRPVYSYRLSIVHFWSLVFIYIWAGPHHLLNTALPQWLQYLGMFFSLMLWAPSWGGMLNGLLTLRGAWDKLRTDPVIKFFAVAVTFYGMSTFEGPLLSIRAVNSLSHYSDWTIGHVHGGTLGWNGFMAAGMFYWLAPRLWKTKLWSTSMANMHFWIGTVGILLYVASMWVAGISQGLQLNELNAEGTAMKNEFVQTLTAIWWPTLFRGIGGAFYLIGFLLLVINIFATIKSGVAEEEKREIFVLPKEKKDNMRWTAVFANDPIAYSFWGLVFMLLWFFLPRGADLMALVCTLGLGFMAVRAFKKKSKKWSEWYEQLLDNWAPFTVLVFIAVVIGGLVQLIPNVTVNRAANVEGRRQVPYTPLELAGRDIYVSEGCYNCHSQMIRTLLPDVLRYQNHTTNGYSRLGESIYDHPFQWGSKRTGPDLAREGGFRGDDWHYSHMYDPRSLSPYSNMPPYPWLFKKETDIKALPKKIAVQTTLGVPYGTMTRDEIEQSAIEQGTEIAKRLVEKGVPYYGGGDEPKTPADMIAELHDKQIVALIAYLQKLGTFEEIAPKDESEPGMLRPNTPDAHREKAKAALAKPDPSGAETASTR